MRFSLIVCTYMRPDALRELLESVSVQTEYPAEVLIIDGSTNRATADMLERHSFQNLKYFLVPDEYRGLTRQRNYGIARVGDVDVVCFLDDDTVLEPDYFERLLSTYDVYPEALGVGGYITNEVTWEASPACSSEYFCFDGWRRREGSRWRMRKRLHLDADVPPGHLPEFSHGRSISFLPPSGKTYPVQQLMGGVSSFRRSVFSRFSFSHYFEGYGLYEDADFTLRVSATGPLYVNTAARLAHYHAASGRPNQYRYGVMVVRNGWYVWRVKYPNPRFKAVMKWHAITMLLTLMRFANAITGPGRRAAFSEALGRTSGWISVLLRRPE